MRALSRAVRDEIEGGPVIPPVFSALEAKQARIRRAELSMIAGQPGAGKSTLALALAVKSKAKTLYFSADTHAHTMALRTAAMLTGRDQQELEPQLESDPVWASRVLQAVDHIKWCFEPSPDMETIEEEIDVYAETQGEYPELIVVDNAVDVTHADGDEFASLRSLMRELKVWARDTEAATLVLHHTSEAVPGEPCPPRWAIHGKVSQTPATILTVAAPGPGLMAVCPVKNRYGPADVSGKDVAWLAYDPSTMTVADVESRSV